MSAASGDKKNIVKMAYIYFQEGRWDKAIEEYKKLIDMDPEDINTHNMLGDVYLKKGSVAEAFDEYLKVSNDFSSRGQLDKTTVVNKKIAALDSSKLSAENKKKQDLIKQTLKAETALEQGDVEAAIQALDELLKLDSENLAAYSKLAEMFEKAGRSKDAVKPYLVLGGAFFKNRLYKKAQEMYQKVIQLDVENIEARIELAQVYIKQGAESDAKKEFLNIAELALGLNDLEKAKTYTSKAIEFKSIEAHYIMGMVLLKQQKLSEAKSEFENLLRFKVNHVGALINLGRVLMEMDQTDKAQENLQKALKIEKDNVSALEAWAELLIKKGSKSEAATTLKSLIERYAERNDLKKAADSAGLWASLDENVAGPFEKLGELMFRLGEKKKAANAYLRAAAILEKQNKPEQSKALYLKARESDPGADEAVKIPNPSPDTSEPSLAVKPSLEKVVPPKVQPSLVVNLDETVVEPVTIASVPSNSPIPPSPPNAVPNPARVVELDEAPTDETGSQVVIAENYVAQGMIEEAIEIYQQLVENHPDRSDLKEKLNHAYTVYVKTGEGVVNALEAEKKQREEESVRLRLEMEKKVQEEEARFKSEMDIRAREEDERKKRAELEQKAREEAEKQARLELERLAREAAEVKAKEETERRVNEEVQRRLKDELLKKEKEIEERRLKEEGERRAKEEVDRKAKEEVERQLREALDRRNKEDAAKKSKEEQERKVREETEKKLQEEKHKKDELEKKLIEKAKAESDASSTTRAGGLPSKGDAVIEDKDDFMTIAVADIYTRQGMHEEALKIYKRIVQSEPGNLEAQKKLSDLEVLMKDKGMKPSEKGAVKEPPSVPPAINASAPPPTAEPIKDSGGKKKSNRVGYV